MEDILWKLDPSGTPSPSPSIAGEAITPSPSPTISGAAITRSPSPTPTKTRGAINPTPTRTKSTTPTKSATPNKSATPTPTITRSVGTNPSPSVYKWGYHVTIFPVTNGVCGPVKGGLRIQNNSQLIIGKYYKYSTKEIYYVTSTASLGGALKYLTTPYSTCKLACGNRY